MITEISSALASLKAASDLFQVVRSSSTTLSDAERNLKMADLANALADARIKVADIQEVLLAQRDKIAQLEAQVRGDVYFDKPFYWRKRAGQTPDGPFCPACYDSKSQALMRLHEYTQGWWDCKVCAARYEDKARSRPFSQRAASDYDPFST